MALEQNAIEILLGLLVIAFTAWSAAVWRAASSARDQYIRIDATLSLVAGRVAQVEQKMDEHIGSAGHPACLSDINGLRRDIEMLRALHHP